MIWPCSLTGHRKTEISTGLKVTRFMTLPGQWILCRRCARWVRIDGPKKPIDMERWGNLGQIAAMTIMLIALFALVIIIEGAIVYQMIKAAECY